MGKKSQAEIIKQLSHKELLLNVYASQLFIFIIAIILSFIFFDPFTTIFHLFRLDGKWIIIGALSGFVVAMLDILLMKKFPSYYDDGGINEKIFTNLSIWQTFLLVSFIAIAEELLFRGVVQTKWGLVIACIIFALVHIRYWKHWYLILNIVILSFWIGLLYKWSGYQLLSCIAMHFTIDFLLGLYISRKSTNLEGGKNNGKE